MRSTPARSAQTASCSTAAARKVSAAQTSTDWPFRSVQIRQLADRRRLARAVDADDQDDVRRVAGAGAAFTSFRMRA